MERQSFRIGSGESPETMRKLCLSIKLAQIVVFYTVVLTAATQMIQTKNNIAPEIMKELFVRKTSPYDFVIIILFREKEQILSGMALNHCPILVQKYGI